MDELKRIIYDNEAKIVVDILDNDTSITASALPVIIDTLKEGRVSLLLKGVNVKLIEDQLDISQSELADLHTQDISPLTIDEEGTSGITRIVDVVLMPVIPIQDKFTLVCKVKHYQDDIYLGDSTHPDTIKVLSAEDEEYVYFRDLMKGGANMFTLFTQFITLRDSEGRFN